MTNIVMQQIKIADYKNIFLMPSASAGVGICLANLAKDHIFL